MLGGEGVHLANVAADAVRDGIRQERDPRAGPLKTHVLEGDTTQWCRGAAVLAIQTYVLAQPA
ncbi:MAG TPA: hypothetical protein VF218_04895 [Acidothermaceae bacterium]